MFDFNEKNKPRLHFIRTVEPRNAGDMNCSPISYFKEFLEEYICYQHCIDGKIDWDVIRPTDWIILGGGGLFDVRESYQQNINYLLSKGRVLGKNYGRVISWSCGHNRHIGGGKDNEVNTAVNYGDFYVLTVRDYNYNSEYGTPERYLPCVSCMHDGFSTNQDITVERQVGIVEHRDFPITIEGYDKISNGIDIEQILAFIGTSELIITNSYHIVYWSQLLKKKVILYKKFSSKFDYFEYPPTEFSGDLDADIRRATKQPDSQYLRKCRDMNRSFFREVSALIYDDWLILKALYEIFESIKDKNCAVKGAGWTTFKLLRILEGLWFPKCIWSNENNGEFEFDYEIVNDLEVKKYELDVIVVSSFKYRKEMGENIKQVNKNYEIFDIYEELSSKGIHLDSEL